MKPRAALFAPTLVLACVLMCALALLLPGPARAAEAVAGRDYVLIDGGTPYRPLDGKIEVVEVFAYWCQHCARFQPLIDAWKRKLPRDVRFTPLPLPSGREDAFARGFFAVQAAGKLERVHAPLFLAVHQQQAVPRNPSIDELSAWYGQQGLDAKQLRAAMAAPALGTKLGEAYRFAQRSGLEGTPTLIVNGRYRILGRSLQEYLANADAVIAQLRAGR